MIRALSSTGKWHVTIVTEIEQQSHEAKDQFMQAAQEHFDLATLIDEHRSDSADVQNRFFEYLILSRGIQHVYVRNSAAGYRLVEHLGSEALRSDLGIRFYDVQHLYTLKDEGGWEYTSRPYHSFLDKRIVVSESMKGRLWDLLCASGQNPADTLTVLPPSVDTEGVWNPMAYLNDAVDDREPITLYFVGRFDEQKDPLKWLQVAKKLCDLHQTQLRFMMIGEGPLLDRSKKAAEKLKLPVKFSGTFWSGAEIAKTLSCGPAHSGAGLCPRSRGILLLTSENEGLPMIVLESVSLGVPVVSPPVGAIGEIASVANGLVKVGNGQSIRHLSAMVSAVISSYRFGTAQPSKAFYRHYGREAVGNKVMDLFS